MSIYICDLWKRRIPVPREPFSFGGLYGTRSKYGDMDITGDGAMEFFSNRVKVTSKWPIVRGKSSVAVSRKRKNGSSSNEVEVATNGDGNGNGNAGTSESAQEPNDAANFAGQM